LPRRGRGEAEAICTRSIHLTPYASNERWGYRALKALLPEAWKSKPRQGRGSSEAEAIVYQKYTPSPVTVK
jgi:hypothetical protein